MLMADEGHCSICSDWPARDREGMRDMLEWSSVDEPICEACLMAWAENSASSAEEEPETLH